MTTGASSPVFPGILLVALSTIAGAQLVSMGTGGLVYQTYANEGQDNSVNTVPDFSRAGYQGGGVAIPFVPARITLTPSGGDDATAIQNAIDTVSALPVDSTGFRGAVLLTEGEFRVSSTLAITAGGVVVRGAGQQDGGGTRITHTATTQSNLFEISGSGGPVTIGNAHAIADAFVPVGSTTLHLTDASGFVPGDLIQITNLMNQKWIDDIGMDSSGTMGAEAWTPGAYQLKHFRFVESVTGNQLTLDAPIVQTIENLYGGGTVRKATWSGALENVGIEGIRMESAFASDTDEQHGWHAIAMHGVRNGWVRQITSRYFGQGLVTITDRCMFVTVEDCAHLDPKSTTAGGNRYSFNIDDSSYILFQRCLARDGRHDFVSGSQTPGPNAFVDGLATAAQNDIGPHHRYSTGQIYDNIRTEENPDDADDAIRVQNRTTSGSGHGWSGAQVLFWNCDAPEIVCDAPVGAMNWAIGNVGVQADSRRSPDEPFGIWESHNVPVLPRSLYYAQLADRLGSSSLQNVALPAQATGTIWTELKDWDGNGLFLDGLISWRDEVTPTVGAPLGIRGVIRDLRMLGNAFSVSWSKVSGPGSLCFGDSASLETAVLFDEAGIHQLKLAVDDGTRTLESILEVTVVPQGAVTAPPEPTGLTATFGQGSVHLAWDVPPGADPVTYTVYRSTNAVDLGEKMASGLESGSFVDPSVVPGTIYHYRVQAVNSMMAASVPGDAVGLVAANTLPADYDFGSGPGKLTPAEASFVPVLSGDGVFQLREDGFEAVADATAGFKNFAFLQPFAGLGGVHSNDFRIIAEIRVNELVGNAQENNDRWGIRMFGTRGNELAETDGIAALVYAKGNTGTGAPENALLVLSHGLNAPFIESAAWVGGSITQGDKLRLEVAGIYNNEGALSLGFTLSRADGSDAQTLTAVVSGAVLANDQFGGCLRIKNGRAIEYDRFQLAFLTVPPPAGLAATAADRAVSLDWSDHVSGDFASYKVYRSESAGDYGTALSTGLTGSNHTDVTAINGTTYHYVVTAVDDHGNESGFSNEVSATAAKTDSDFDGIDDSWEIGFFCDKTSTDGHGDFDGDGVPDFFEYLYGSNPSDPASRGFRLLATRDSSGDGAVFQWDTDRGFVLGTDYRIEVSAGLSRWDPLPAAHYTLGKTSLNGMERHELRFIHDHGGKAFIRLAQP